MSTHSTDITTRLEPMEQPWTWRVAANSIEIGELHFALLRQGGWFQVCSHGACNFDGVRVSSVATTAAIAYCCRGPQ